VNPHAPAAPKSDICDGHHISEVSQPGCDRHGPRPDPQVASLCRIGPRRANRKPAGSLNGPRPCLGLALRVLSYANEGFAARGANLQEISKEIQAWLQDCHTAAG
jgi:hypothetical protein